MELNDSDYDLQPLNEFELNEIKSENLLSQSFD